MGKYSIIRQLLCCGVGCIGEKQVFESGEHLYSCNAKLILGLHRQRTSLHAVIIYFAAIPLNKQLLNVKNTATEAGGKRETET